MRRSHREQRGNSAYLTFGPGFEQCIMPVQMSLLGVSTGFAANVPTIMGVVRKRPGLIEGVSSKRSTIKSYFMTVKLHASR
jgi:hypothetical protein